MKAFTTFKKVLTCKNCVVFGALISILTNIFCLLNGSGLYMKEETLLRFLAYYFPFSPPIRMTSVHGLSQWFIVSNLMLLIGTYFEILCLILLWLVSSMLLFIVRTFWNLYTPYYIVCKGKSLYFRLKLF